MINKKLVWRAAARLKGDFSLNELIDEISKEGDFLNGVIGERRFFKLEDVVNSVLINNNVKRSDLMSRKRQLEIKNARNIGMYLAYKYTEFPLVRVGEYFGRDHATVINARKRIKEAKEGYDKELLELLKASEKTLLSCKILYVKGHSDELKEKIKRKNREYYKKKKALSIN
jgi:hypothetical protein